MPEATLSKELGERRSLSSASLASERVCVCVQEHNIHVYSICFQGCFSYIV